MRKSTSPLPIRSILLSCLMLLTLPAFGAAQEREAGRGARRASLDPFVAIAANDSRSVRLNFDRTELDKQVKATAQIALRDNVLLVRVHAADVPQPSRFGVPRYALWVYVPNYKIKMYIGDLPVTPSRRATDGRGTSDSAYRFAALPPNAIFGGLMLTAEPVRYTPIVEEALKPLLVALVPEVNITDAAAAPALYAAPYAFPQAAEVKPTAPRKR